MNSFIKKIVTVPEWEAVGRDITELHETDNIIYGHACNLKHDTALIIKALSHESLLVWNMHIWAHFNGKKWDALFIGQIRKSEKFNKKGMEEYLWLSKNPRVGMKLYNIAYEFAKQQGCYYMLMNVAENQAKVETIKNLYKRLGYEKDTETYIKLVI